MKDILLFGASNTHIDILSNHSENSHCECFPGLCVVETMGNSIDLYQTLDMCCREYEYDTVIVVLGANDLGNEVDIQELNNKMVDLFENVILRALPNAKCIWILTIIDANEYILPDTSLFSTIHIKNNEIETSDNVHWTQNGRKQIQTILRPMLLVR